MAVTPGNLRAMSTFGKRDNHIELDPWAKRERPRDDAPRSSGLARSRIAVYVTAVVTVGVLALAGLQMLVMA